MEFPLKYAALKAISKVSENMGLQPNLIRLYSSNASASAELML